MSISIDYSTHVINVSKDESLYLSNDSITGREIRQLNVESFRRTIGFFLATEMGITLPDAYTHEFETNLDGVTYAKKINFLDPYTYTFEDGDYTVYFTGANTNLLSKTNVNGVSFRSANSAGLVDTRSPWEHEIPGDLSMGTYGHYLVKELLTVLRYVGMKDK